MTQRHILAYPDPRLRRRAQPVRQFDGALAALIDDLFETLYATRAIGLAATQVDVHLQLIVLDVSGTASAPRVFINPRVTSRRQFGMVEESCLSVPGLVRSVKRATRLSVQARARDGELFERDLEGLEAVCLEHEIDHLRGRLFLDRLAFLERWRVRRALAGAAASLDSGAQPGIP